MDGNWNDMKYIEIAPLNDSTDCSYPPDLPDVPSVDHEPVYVKVCVLFFLPKITVSLKILHFN